MAKTSMGRFTIPPTIQQEQFSIAYVRAIASVAGYSIDKPEVDTDSIDLAIVQCGDDEFYPDIERLHVQLKCTYTHVPNEEQGCIKFPLKIKNYNDLRRNCAIPRILVVVHTPREVHGWLTHSEDSLSLYHSAYWVSLRNAPATENQDSVTIDVPLNQKFTVDELSSIMNLLAMGEKP
jgi:hypothetical protein